MVITIDVELTEKQKNVLATVIKRNGIILGIRVLRLLFDITLISAKKVVETVFEKELKEWKESQKG